jgi:hypothetical protein
VMNAHKTVSDHFRTLGQCGAGRYDNQQSGSWARLRQRRAFRRGELQVNGVNFSRYPLARSILRSKWQQKRGCSRAWCLTEEVNAVNSFRSSSSHSEKTPQFQSLRNSTDLAHDARDQTDLPDPRKGDTVGASRGLGALTRTVLGCRQ